MDMELCVGRIMERRGLRSQMQGCSHPSDGLCASINMPLGAQWKEQGMWQVLASLEMQTLVLLCHLRDKSLSWYPYLPWVIVKSTSEGFK